MCSMVMVPRVCPTLPWLINGGVHQTFTDLNDDIYIYVTPGPNFVFFAPEGHPFNLSRFWEPSVSKGLSPFLAGESPCFGCINPSGLSKIKSITHDGSMVLHLVCHGSHQYTPFMLAYIPYMQGGAPKIAKLVYNSNN